MPKQLIPNADEGRTANLKSEEKRKELQGELKESSTEIVLNEQPEGEIGLG